MNQFQNLSLTSLVASPTNPRKTFEPVALNELAEQIAATGVNHTILVRPLPAHRLENTSHLVPRPEYEIVAGERRYRASIIANRDTIPAMIRTMTDDEAIEAALIENIQRDDLNPLELAEGIDHMMQSGGLTSDQVAVKLKKSRTSVYNSLKLLKLSPTAKLAMREQGLTASVAELIARIPNDALQAKALAFAVAPDGDGDKPSYRTFSQWAQRNVMLNLQHATFDIKDATTFDVGACLACSKRTGANPDLFTDVKSADMCTDPPCYHNKTAVQDELEEKDKDDAASKDRDRFNDSQQGLGLESTLAHQMTANPAKRIEAEIATIKANVAFDVAKAVRLATFDELVERIKSNDYDKFARDLLSPSLLRAWLLKIVAYDDNDDVALMLHMPLLDEYPADFVETCTRRVEAAIDIDLERYATTYLLIEDRNASRQNAVKPATMMIGFAKDNNIDLQPIADEVQAAAEAEMKSKIQALNKAIKAAKTTSTPAPAGAANDDAAADAKKSKPAGASRKAKTTAQEAISGIAAAMQGLGSEPLDASLGGSEAAAVDSGKLAVGAKVKVLDGKHIGKDGSITKEIGSEMWNIELLSSVGLPFAVFLPTKSLQVIA